MNLSPEQFEKLRLFLCRKYGDQFWSDTQGSVTYHNVRTPQWRSWQGAVLYQTETRQGIQYSLHVPNADLISPTFKESLRWVAGCWRIPSTNLEPE